MTIANKYFADVESARTGRNSNEVSIASADKLKNRLKLGTAVYDSVQNIVSSSYINKQKLKFFSLLNPSKHNTNEICTISFNGALPYVSTHGSHHQAKYNKPIPNYRIACYIISSLELDFYIHIQ
jgi:hypothetical protein